MCINVVRWFLCPRYGNPRAGTTAKPRPEWRHGDAVPRTEAAPADDKWHFLRHKEDASVCCAMSRSSECTTAPKATRVELYNIPCSECTGDDSCVPSKTPKVFWEGHNGLSDEEQGLLNRVARCYFQELCVLHKAWLRHTVLDLPIQGPLVQRILYGSLMCTQHSQHRRLDQHLLVGHPDCSCPSIVNKPAHNLARALRAQDAMALRLSSTGDWLDNAARYDLDAYVQDAGYPPNQTWFDPHVYGWDEPGYVGPTES
ncbi:hypothetical protein G7046_g3267 [Stylonectria norvegica]|nr:hypothetical protein G7046_g3267 [Stylonectria norvegica]